MGRSSIRLVGMLILAAALFTKGDKLLSIPMFIIFGDSTVDVGTNNYLDTLVKSDFQPYGRDCSQVGSGRFSNGLLVADFIGTVSLPSRYSLLLGFPSSQFVFLMCIQTFLFSRSPKNAWFVKQLDTSTSSVAQSLLLPALFDLVWSSIHLLMTLWKYLGNWRVES